MNIEKRLKELERINHIDEPLAGIVFADSNEVILSNGKTVNRAACFSYSNFVLFERQPNGSLERIIDNLKGKLNIGILVRLLKTAKPDSFRSPSRSF